MRSYPHLVDNFSLQKLALHCNYLTEFFRGVWSAGNFPSMCNDNEEDGTALFQIVNTQPSYLPGKHWVLLSPRTKQSGTFDKKILWITNIKRITAFWLYSYDEADQFRRF